MDRIQESFHLMELAFRDFVDLNARITSTISGFGKFFTVYSGNILKIQFLLDQQEKDNSGFARQKSLFRADLCTKALDVSRKIATYAKMTQNSVLAQEVHYSETDLKRSTDSVLKNRASVILEKAEMNLTELEAYGVTAEMVAALKSVLEQFISYIPKPRMGIIEKKQATDQLAALFAANNELLENMDALVEIVRNTEPEFFHAYRDHRKIIGKGKVSLSLKATVTDPVTHTGIKGVKVSFVHQYGPSKITGAKQVKPVEKITTPKGNFQIRNIAAGTYKVTLNKPGYKEQSVIVNVADNETAVLHVELERD